MAIAGVVGMWLSWRFFVSTEAGQRLDETAFTGSEFGRNTLWRAAEPVLDVVSVPFVVVVLGAAAVIAVVRRRWFMAIQVAVLVGGANVTTQALKHVVIDRPTLTSDVGTIENSLPSGHTTVAASVAAALVLVVPRGARPVVAILGAGYATITGISTMIGGWHRPSDVIAAIAVVLCWAGLTTVITAISSPERAGAGPSPRTRATTAATALFGVIAAGSGAIAVYALVRTRDRLGSTGLPAERSDLVPAYVGGSFGVVAAAAVTFGALLVAHQVASDRPSVEPTRVSPIG